MEVVVGGCLVSKVLVGFAVEGLGLDGNRGPAHVAELGKRGGAMLSYLGGYSASRSSLACEALLELRFQLRLNFLRIEEPVDGVSGVFEGDSWGAFP